MKHMFRRFVRFLHVIARIACAIREQIKFDKNEIATEEMEFSVDRQDKQSIFRKNLGMKKYNIYVYFKSFCFRHLPI